MGEHNKDTKDFLTKKDIHALLWRGRDFELTSLWQRSVFLATFLVLIFTAYVGLWSAVLGRMNDTQAYISSTHYLPHGFLTIEASPNPRSALSLFAVLSNSIEFGIGFFVLSLMGSSFSILWIFMAKGSKYWYERYETSISAIEEDKGLFSDEINHEWEREKSDARQQNREEQHIPIHGYLRKGKTNSFLLSPKGGAYSVSKVNILIGVVFLFFWLLAQIFHVGILCNQYIPWCGWIIAVLFVLCLNASLIALLGWCSRSGEAGWKSWYSAIRCDRTALHEENRPRKQKNEWLASRLEERPFGEYQDVFGSINTKDEYPGDQPLACNKLKKMVEESTKMNKDILLINYLQEHVIAYSFPRGMQGVWKTADRSITLTSEKPCNLRDNWMEQMVGMIIKSDIVPEKRMKVRVFSDIPWAEIEKKADRELSTEDYSSWSTTFVLYDERDSSTALCTEEFTFREGLEKEGAAELESAVRWMDSLIVRQFYWEKDPSPKRANREEKTDSNGG